MNKTPTQDIREEIIETVEPVETPDNGGEIRSPKRGWMFPNIIEGLPFGGEFETREEAEEANKHYLNKMKGSK